MQIDIARCRQKILIKVKIEINEIEYRYAIRKSTRSRTYFSNIYKVDKSQAKLTNKIRENPLEFTKNISEIKTLSKSLRYRKYEAIIINLMLLSGTDMKLKNSLMNIY